MSGSARRVPPTTAYERLAGLIREQILSGELVPGDRLPNSADVSEHYSVSLSTAREALRTLESQGLVAVRRGVTGGTFVAHPRPEHVSDSLQTGLALLASGAQLPVAGLMEVRELLEVPAAEAAAFRRTEEDLVALRASLFDVDAMPPDTVFACSRQFHARVVAAAHNPWLELVAAPVFRVLQDRFRRELEPGTTWRHIDRDHRGILGYLESGDEAGAREAARAHIRSLHGFYERVDNTAG